MDGSRRIRSFLVRYFDRCMINAAVENYSAEPTDWGLQE